MICFRDMTFCPFNEDCANAEGCFRALTEQVRIEADAWWGDSEGGPPICVFSAPPDCHEKA